MKAAEVQEGHIYRMKVSGKIQQVKITCASLFGGWNAVNLATNRNVRIKRATKLRGEVTE